MIFFLSYTVRIIAIIISVLILGAYVWPLWTGASIHSGGNIRPGDRVIIPDYYNEAADWLREQEGDFRILTLPLHKIFNVAYSWEHGFQGTDPTFRLLPKNVVISGLDGNGLGTTLSELITTDATADFGKFLSLINAKYIIFHRDANLAYMEAVPWNIATTLEDLEGILRRQPGISLEKTFGKLDFYRNEYWQPAHLYGTSDITYVDGDRQALVPLAAVGGLDAPPAIFLNTHGEDITRFTSDRANNLLILPSEEVPGQELEIITNNQATDEINFETGDFGSWVATRTPQDSTGSLQTTNTDSHSGEYAAELAISGGGRQAHLHRDFNYDGNNPININAWLKIVSHTAPAGAFIYLKGYDAQGLQKVQIIYHTYENWDIRSGMPGEWRDDYGDYPFYSLKVSLGNPEIGKWTNIDRNPRDDFEARFPGVWEKLNLTRIRLDLNSWCDGEITTLFDDIRLSGITKVTTKNHFNYSFSVPEEGSYGLYALIPHYYDGDFLYSIDDGLATNPTEIIKSDDHFNKVKFSEPWLGEGNHMITLTFQDDREVDDFETGGFGSWVAVRTPQDNARSIEITSTDSHSGEYAVELVISGEAGSAHLYKDLDYDGDSYINFDAWLKITSHTPPAGAFVSLYGYDAQDVERVRIIYHAYENWDVPTGIPGEWTDYGDYPFYSLKVSLGNPEIGKWTQIDGNPRDEFEAHFPGVWESLDLVRIRLDLNSWCNGEIATLFDDIRLTSQYYGVEIGSVFGTPVSHLYLYSKDEPDSSPEITFQMVNPTNYQIHVNTEQPFTLVLSESYHPMWKAYYGEKNWLEAWLSQPIDEENHLQANGYANAWYIDKVGEYNVTLYFKTQQMFYMGAILSGFGLSGGIIYIGWRWVMRSKR